MFGRKKNIIPEYTDAEVIMALQSNDAVMERTFYLSCQSYFKERRVGVFDYAAGAREAQDLFHDSFLTLWQEIQAKRIFVRDNYAWRIDRAGNNRRMSASLKTYLMAIAKYKNYELLRESEIYGSHVAIVPDAPDEEQDDNTAQWVVERCVNALPQRCKEILTLFYYEEKSLDEILAIRRENQSKDGLKTGKSKCMKTLRTRITAELERLNLKPYHHA